MWLKGKDLGCSGAADFIAERPKNGFETQKIAHSLPYGWPTIRTNLDFEYPIPNLKCLNITKNSKTFPILRLHLFIFYGRQGLIVTCVKWCKSKKNPASTMQKTGWTNHSFFLVLSGLKKSFTLDMITRGQSTTIFLCIGPFSAW